MAFVKVQKTKSYFKRYQTAFRRRREGKTDYYARKRLVIQDKDKYNSPKYRLVVRLTNQKVICDIVYATLQGDKVLCHASSDELKKLGLTAGLTNYASCYATGLLLARRLLKSLKMDGFYKSNSKINGEDYNVEENPNPDRRPFKAVLDIGLVNTTTGNKVFGAMKGACDGGLFIPHSAGRFPGNKTEGENQSYDAKVHRDRIFGVHVDLYMKQLKEESQEEYLKQFADWDKCLKANKVNSVEALYTKLHKEINDKPDAVKKPKAVNPKRDHKTKRTARIGRIQRRNKANQKIEIALKQK